MSILGANGGSGKYLGPSADARMLSDVLSQLGAQVRPEDFVGPWMPKHLREYLGVSEEQMTPRGGAIAMLTPPQAARLRYFMWRVENAVALASSSFLGPHDTASRLSAIEVAVIEEARRTEAAEGVQPAGLAG